MHIIYLHQRHSDQNVKVHHGFNLQHEEEPDNSSGNHKSETSGREVLQYLLRISEGVYWLGPISGLNMLLLITMAKYYNTEKETSASMKRIMIKPPRTEIGCSWKLFTIAFRLLIMPENVTVNLCAPAIFTGNIFRSIFAVHKAITVWYAFKTNSSFVDERIYLYDSQNLWKMLLHISKTSVQACNCVTTVFSFHLLADIATHPILG